MSLSNNFLTKSVSKTMPSMPKMPSMKTPSMKMPSMKMSSMKMPSMKMSSMKMPSMPTITNIKPTNITSNIFQTITKNFSIILIFMILIFILYVIVQIFNVNFQNINEKEINDEKIYIFEKKKKLIEGHGEYTSMKKHTGDVNKNKFCFGGCAKYEYDANGVKTCAKDENGVDFAMGKYKKMKERNVIDKTKESGYITEAYLDPDEKVDTACCQDIKDSIWAKGVADGGYWVFNWKELSSWQEKHKEWFCHCYLGVNPIKKAFTFFDDERRQQLKDVHPSKEISEISKMIDKEWKKLSEKNRKKYEQKEINHSKNSANGGCCKSILTGTIVKPDHPDSDCNPKNKRDKFSSCNSDGSTAANKKCWCGFDVCEGGEYCWKNKFGMPAKCKKDSQPEQKPLINECLPCNFFGLECPCGIGDLHDGGEEKKGECNSSTDCQDRPYKHFCENNKCVCQYNKVGEFCDEDKIELDKEDYLTHKIYKPPAHNNLGDHKSATDYTSTYDEVTPGLGGLLTNKMDFGILKSNHMISNDDTSKVKTVTHKYYNYKDPTTSNLSTSNKANNIRTESAKKAVNEWFEKNEQLSDKEIYNIFNSNAALDGIKPFFISTTKKHIKIRESELPKGDLLNPTNIIETVDVVLGEKRKEVISAFRSTLPTKEGFINMYQNSDNDYYNKKK